MRLLKIICHLIYFQNSFSCQSICKLAWTIMVIHFASMHNSKHRLFFQNAQFSKPSKLRGMMPRKVNYSMHFACTHYNIGVIGLILDEDFQVSIVIGTNKNPITKDLSNNFLIFIISFSFFLYRWFSLSSALFTQSSTSLYLPT